MSIRLRSADAADRTVPVTKLAAARLAVGITFFLNGFGTGNWVVRIPAIQERLHIGPALLGTGLLCVSLGALCMMPATGFLTSRFGSRVVTRVGAVGFALALTLPALAPSYPWLIAAFFVLGAAVGGLDVAMNAHAVVVERTYGRPIMFSFHALYSAGGLVGSVLGGALAERLVAPATHLAFVALAALVAAVLATSTLLEHDSDPQNVDASPPQRPTARLLILGMVAFNVLICEGAVADWSAVFLRQALHARPGLAAIGYAAFSLCMTVARFAGDPLATRFTRGRLVLVGGLLATLGLLLVVASNGALVAIVGFGAAGLGCSVVFPAVLSAAGQTTRGSAGTAIAAVSTMGYTGFLFGPPLIGWVSEWTSLRGGFIVVVSCAAVVVVLSRTRFLETSAGRRDRNASNDTAVA